MRAPALLLAVLVPGLAIADEIPAVALKAKAVFEKHCYRCHGKDGRSESGFGFVLDRSRLLESGLVATRAGEKSKLFERMKAGTMPPTEDGDGTKLPQPTAAEVNAVADWVAAGAPDFHPPKKLNAIAPGEMYRLMADDLKRIAAEKKRKPENVRYLTLTHLHNAGRTADELQTYRLAINKLVNSLNRTHNEIHNPAPLDPDKTILRLYLDDYDWDAATWNRLLTPYPYGLQLGIGNGGVCQEMTGTKLPDIRGDWFVYAASRPPLYHQLLGIPDTDAELEKQLGVNAAKNIADEKVARAGFNRSGVSQNNRLIERHRSTHGAYWKSYDADGNLGRKYFFNFPFGPGSDAKSFDHAGGEIIFSLPNGLQGYMLTDAAGKRIDRGPVTIVSDPAQPDRAVLNGVSCMSCHKHGMIDKDDQIRAHVDGNDAFTNGEQAKVLALYPKHEDFRALLHKDRDRFVKALRETGAVVNEKGLPVGSEPVSLLAALFAAELDVRQAAAEAGVTLEKLKEAITGKELGRVLGTLITPGGTVKREVWLDSFPAVANALRLGTPFQAGKPPPLVAPPPEHKAERIDTAAPFADLKLKPLDGKGYQNVVGEYDPFKDEPESHIWAAALPGDGRAMVICTRGAHEEMDGKGTKKVAATLQLWETATGKRVRYHELTPPVV